MKRLHKTPSFYHIKGSSLIGVGTFDDNLDMDARRGFFIVEVSLFSPKTGAYYKNGGAKLFRGDTTYDTKQEAERACNKWLNTELI